MEIGHAIRPLSRRFVASDFHFPFSTFHFSPYASAMPSVFPFRAVTYAKAPRKDGALDVSNFVAPPYDVLDAPSKRALVAKRDRNVVCIALPHLPAKELGPPAAYDGAAKSFRAWLADATLARAAKPVMFVYRETFHYDARQHQRT